MTSKLNSSVSVSSFFMKVVEVAFSVWISNSLKVVLKELSVKVVSALLLFLVLLLRLSLLFMLLMLLFILMLLFLLL